MQIDEPIQAGGQQERCRPEPAARVLAIGGGISPEQIVEATLIVGLGTPKSK
jgi:hypothetical protein